MSSVSLDITELVPRFPGFRVALVVAEGLQIDPQRSAELERFIAEAEAGARGVLGEGDLPAVPEIKSWREAYKAFGVKKTSYRSSVERLLKNVQRGQSLPRVNTLVDAYNAVSLLHRMPVGADDIDNIVPPLAFRFSRAGDTFVALGGDGQDDPPKEGEVVYADAQKILCRRWNWYQDARSPIVPSTQGAVLTIQALDRGPVEAAAAQLEAVLSEHCGASVRWAVADADHPQVTP
jgi:DNA/RNA-binding domain of Phe-tRNA-synthetase-like protein